MPSLGRTAALLLEGFLLHARSLRRLGPRKHSSRFVGVQEWGRGGLRGGPLDRLDPLGDVVERAAGRQVFALAESVDCRRAEVVLESLPLVRWEPDTFCSVELVLLRACGALAGERRDAGLLRELLRAFQPQRERAGLLEGLGLFGELLVFFRDGLEPLDVALLQEDQLALLCGFSLPAAQPVAQRLLLALELVSARLPRRSRLPASRPCL